MPSRGYRLVAAAAVGLLAFAVGCGKQAGPASSSSFTATAPPPAAKGNAQAGKALFDAQRCWSCHTYTADGAHGSIGPNLDHLAADAKRANRGSLAHYIHESIVNPGAYIVLGYSSDVMPTKFGSLGTKKIDDLVAFLTQHPNG